MTAVSVFALAQHLESIEDVVISIPASAVPGLACVAIVTGGFQVHDMKISPICVLFVEFYVSQE